MQLDDARSREKYSFRPARASANDEDVPLASGLALLISVEPSRSTTFQKLRAGAIALAYTAPAAALNSRVLLGSSETARVAQTIRLNQLACVRDPFGARVATELHKPPVVWQDIVWAIRFINIVHKRWLPIVVSTFCHRGFLLGLF